MAKGKHIRSYGGLAPDKYLSREQISQLRDHLTSEAARADTKYGNFRQATNLMLVELLLNTGLRARECCSLRMRDMPVCHGKPVVLVRDAKGKGIVRRTIEIATALTERLEDYIKHYRKNAKPMSFLFVNENGSGLRYWSLYSKIRRIGKRAGIGHLHPHMLRHSFGTWYYNSHLDIILTQDQLGHADQNTTTIYAKTANEERRRKTEAFYL